jgi:iron(III) transport system substrate-binding protein
MFCISRRGALAAAAASIALIQIAMPARAQSGGSLTLYSGQHRQTTQSLVEAFQKATGAKVTVRQGGSSQLANQIIEEGARSPADIFYSEQSPPLVALEEKGLLAKVDADTLKQIPPQYSSAKGMWVGTSMRARVLAYNKAMIKESDLPKSIMDVATPAWKDKVGYVKRDGFQEQIAAIVKLKGRDAALAWLKGLKQYGKLYNGNGAAMNAVESGEIATALVNNYYWFGAAKERGEQNMKSALYYFPKGDAGALINVSPAGIVKTTKNAALAQKFLAFAVSEEGQKAIVAPYAEYPVRPGIVSPFKLKPIDEIGFSVTANDVGGAQIAYDLMREAGML